MTEPITLIVKICSPDGEVLKTLKIIDSFAPWGALVGLVDAVEETVRVHYNCADDA